MLSTFLLAIAINQAVMFFLDIRLNKRVYNPYLKHFVLTAPAIAAVAVLMKFFPAYDLQYVAQSNLHPFIQLAVGLLIFDAFIFVMHKYVEHGPFWSWHKTHHKILTDEDLTYYSPAPVGPEENFYYIGMIFLIPCFLGMSDFMMFVTVSWIFQHGGYVHQKGLPELPWPLLSCRHHRNHHYSPKTYFGGLFLIWDKAAPIDPKSIDGYIPKKKPTTA